MIAHAPRPPSSAEHERARDYLVGALRHMGLTTEVQQAIAISLGRQKAKPWLLPGAAALAGYNMQHPRPNNIFYGLDVDGPPAIPGRPFTPRPADTTPYAPADYDLATLGRMSRSVQNG